MRFSLIRLATHTHFGNAGRLHGEYKFSLSPDEQKPFKGFFKDAFINVFMEYVWRKWYFYTPPAVFYYCLYDWCKKEHARLSRKDPYDYAFDE